VESAPGTAGMSASSEPVRTEAARGPIIATVVGLVFALAGVLAAPEEGPADPLAQRVAVALPDWLVVAAFGSVLLAGAVLIALAFPRPRRRRKKGEDDYEMYLEPRRVSPLLGIALILLAVSPAVALTGLLFWLGRENVAAPPGPGAISPHHGPLVPAPLAPALRPAGEGAMASPVTTGLVGAVAVLAAFAALGFVWWLAFGDRWMRRQPFDDRYRGQVAQAVEASLGDLASEPDARLAIRKIYQNFERVLAGAEVRRRPWQTPAEFARAALARLPLPRQLVEELTRLFEIARFSTHPLGASERERAWQSLTAIRSEMEAARERPDAHVS